MTGGIFSRLLFSKIKSFWKAQNWQFDDCRISELVQPRERPFWNAKGF